MTPARVPDRVWRRIDPILPPGTYRQMSNRQALDAIVYVLTENCGWRTLDRRTWGFHGSTVWRRLRYWQDEGAWDDVAEIISKSRPDLDDSARERLRNGRRGMSARHYRRWAKRPEGAL